MEQTHQGRRHPRRVAPAMRLTIALIIAFTAVAANAQNFPNKPIRIVAGGVGGGSDFTARMIAQGFTAAWGQQVVVDNRPSGFVPGEIVMRAQPDGYTLLVSGSSLWISRLLQDNVPFDAERDFAAVTLAATSPSVLTVHPAVAAKSVRELMALAKMKPGELNYGTSGQGSAPHLAAELFKAMAGVSIVRVNYKGAGAALNDLIAGQVQMTFGTTSSLAPHIKSGRLRALAVSGAQPSALLPELPTIAASGLPGYEAVSPAGVFAPAKTPASIVARLNAEIVRALNATDAKQKLLGAGIEVVGTTPAELAAMIKADIAKWGKVIRDAGIRADQ